MDATVLMDDDVKSSQGKPCSSTKEQIIERKLSPFSAVNGTVLKAIERRVFGMNVAAARVARGWTLTDLGERMLASPSYIRQIEEGLVNISIDRMASFAKIFRFQLYELLNPRFRSNNLSEEDLRREDRSARLIERKPKVFKNRKP